ncbi:hypothetical protein QUB19_21145 [Microcoleus sp. B4-C5]|uniref:hypothetical protein n=1 Tax=unclassified Microcoleus TaxID=2642155 RepID=UPI002FD23405
MCVVKILEKNSERISFKVGKKGKFSVSFIVIMVVLILGFFLLLLPMWLSDIGGNLFSICLLLGAVGYGFYTVGYTIRSSLCTFNFKTNQIEVFQESPVRKHKINQSIDNFLNFTIIESSSGSEYGMISTFSVYLTLVSNKNIYLGSGSIEEKQIDSLVLDEIQNWIERNK